MTEKELNQKFEDYVLKCLKNSCVPEEMNYTIKSDDGFVRFFFYIYKEEYGWKYPTKINVCEYIRGLPSVIPVAFYNYDIIGIAKSWGLFKEKPHDFVEEFDWDSLENCNPVPLALYITEESFCNEWFMQISKALFRLAKKYRINTKIYKQERCVM